MALSLVETERVRRILEGSFEISGPFLGRDLRVQSGRVRLGDTSGSAAAVAAGGAGVAGGGLTASYQWLYFDEVSGSVPAGAQTFEVLGPPVPFAGAITEVDVSVEAPGGLWQLMVGVESLGPIFRVTQPDEVLTAEGQWRPIPVGLWPETEGLVFPLPSGGLRPRILLARPDDVQPNLRLRVLLVAHPG